MKPSGAFDVRRDFRQAMKALLTAVTLDGIAEPVLSSDTNPDEVLSRRVCECVGRPLSVCGGVLGIKLTSGDPSYPVGRLLRNDAKTEKICRACGKGNACPALGLAHEQESLKGEEPLRPCADSGNCLFNAQKAAFVFLSRLRQKMNLFGVFRELPFWTDRHRTSVDLGPSLHPDVGLTDLNSPIAHEVPAVFVSGLGLEVQGECGGGFREALVRRLTESYGKLVGTPIGGVRKGAPVLTLNPKRGAPKETCDVMLRYQDRNLYGVAASAQNMRNAGDDVGRVIGQFYRDVQHAHAAPAGNVAAGGNSSVPTVIYGPAPRTEPPFSHAFFFSGARQLEYSDGKRGWEWVIAESVLLVAGISLTAAAIAVQNNDMPANPTVDTARLLQGLSYGAFGAVLPLRTVAGLAF
jgi:hypothetical protein